MTDRRTDSELLNSIDSKLSALLAIAIVDRLPDTARAKGRPLDRVLADAGLSPPEIAALMGKTRQAVQQVLADKSTKSTPATQRAATP